MKCDNVLYREDGSEVKIECQLYVDNFVTEWVEIIYTRPRLDPDFPKKNRKFKQVGVYGNDISPSLAAMAELELLNLKFVTKQEILKTKLELWESLKPTI